MCESVAKLACGEVTGNPLEMVYWTVGCTTVVYFMFKVWVIMSVIGMLLQKCVIVYGKLLLNCVVNLSCLIR